jgi:hypothetical protein
VKTEIKMLFIIKLQEVKKMTDERLEEEIEAIERQYIKDKTPFTSVDIGNALKRKGINVRQRQVSPIVRNHFNSDIYNKSEYTRTLVPVKDGKTEAYLYFHIDNEPEDYSETSQDILPWDPNKQMFPDENDSITTIKSNNNLDVVVNDDTNNQVDAASNLGDYVASKKSEVYHDKNCMYSSRINQENIVSFTDTKTAVSEGYRKCRVE